MQRCIKLAHEDPAGLDENPAWDYVANCLCPATHDKQNPREQLAIRLLNGLDSKTSPANKVVIGRAAESLMGTAWVNIYTNPGFLI